MPNFGQTLRLNKLPVLGLVPESSGTAPTSPVTGQLWTDTSVTPKLVRVWDGAAWAPVNNYFGTGAGQIAEGNLAEFVSRKNAASGYAGLDASSKLTYSQIPVSADGASTANTVVQATDTRLSNARTPTDDSVTGGPTGAGVKLKANTITVENLAAALKDGTAGTAQIRSLGTGATQAAAGNDARLSDQRTPLDNSVTSAKIVDDTIVHGDIAPANRDGLAATPSMRTLGFGAQQALSGTSRLDQIAAPTAAVSLNGQRITNLGPSSAATDAVNRAELDAARQGFAGAKDPVRVALQTNVNLASPGATLDGATMAVNDRFLAAGQTTASQNGIYVWNGAAAAATRALDADATGEIKDGTTVAVGEGTYAGAIYIQTIAQTDAPGTAGGTMTWVVFNTGGTTYGGTSNRITVTGSTIDIAATYVGQTSITTLGTVTTGTWNGTDIAVADGGTGASTAAAARTNLGVAQKGYAETMGAVTAGTPYVVTHSLGTQEVIAQVRDASTNEYIYLDIINASTTTVTVTSGLAYAANALKIVVLPVA